MWITIVAIAVSIAVQREAAERVEQQVLVMTHTEAPWELRSKAEIALETLPSPLVLEALLPHVSRPMPRGGIWNSGGREHDRGAPVGWQLYYAAGRVWFHHTYGPGRDAVVGPTLIRLLGRAEGIGKSAVFSAMHRCWGPGMEEPLAEVFFDEGESDAIRMDAVRVALYRNVKPYVPKMLERARAIEAGRPNGWLELLMELRVRKGTGVLREVVDMARAQMKAERAAGGAAAYFTAVRLEGYVGARFRPGRRDVAPPDPRYFEKTVENALAWKEGR